MSLRICWSRAPPRTAAEHHANDATAIGNGRGHEIVAGGAGIAGLDAIDAAHAAEQAVVAVDDLLAEAEAADGEVIVILRKMLAQRDAEASLVTGGGNLCRVRKAVGVAIGGARHAERTGLLRHHAGKALFRAAEHFGKRRRGVVCRTGDEAEHGLFDGDRIARAHTELGRRFARGVLREGNAGIETDLAGFQRFEGQIQRHHLGE